MGIGRGASQAADRRRAFNIAAGRMGGKSKVRPPRTKKQIWIAFLVCVLYVRPDEIRASGSQVYFESVFYVWEREWERERGREREERERVQKVKDGLRAFLVGAGKFWSRWITIPYVFWQPRGECCVCDEMWGRYFITNKKDTRDEMYMDIGRLDKLNHWRFFFNQLCFYLSISLSEQFELYAHGTNGWLLLPTNILKIF